MGKYLSMLGEDGTLPGLSGRGKRAHQNEGPIETTLLVPGVLITWLGNETPAVLDCLHTEPDGSVWAFVSLPDGWAAINTKFVTMVRMF
jgi:hypothetical protein